MKTQSMKINVVDGNKLIADFMGYNIIYGEKPYVPFYIPHGMSEEEYNSEVRQAEAKLAEWEYHNRLQYDTSWGWLMPVVEKIDRLNFETHIIHCLVMKKPGTIPTNLIACRIEDHWNKISIDVEDEIKINAVYKAVVQFIQWYKTLNQLP